jgi:hypothetical protein
MYFTSETAERALMVATLKKQNKTEKEKQKLAATELAAKKKQSELDELKKKFDVDRINLQTALANSTDEAEKARIRSLLTIMDEDANAAAKRMAQLDAANLLKMKADLEATASINKLAEAARSAALGLGGMTIGGVPAAQFMSTAISPAGVANESLSNAVLIESALALMEAEAALASVSGGSGGIGAIGDTYNNFTINTPLGTEDALTEAMQRALQNLNRYGSSTTFAGALQVLP